MSAKDSKPARVGVVIRKEEIVEGGHHGGAWKVAYADFVTAMMAFFLLMWLLNATTEEQRRGLADYFSPTHLINNGRSGSGRPFGGRTPFEDGQLVSDRGTQSIQPGQKSAVARAMDDPDSDQAPDDAEPEEQGNASARASGGAGGQARDMQPEQGQRAPGGGQAAAQAQTPSRGTSLASTGTPPPSVAIRLDEEALKAELDRRERAAFEQAATQILEAIRSDPRLADLARQVSIDQTQEGLRIQLLDEERQPMFATGSAAIGERARLLLHKIAPVLSRLPEDVAISGHTDAAPFRGEGRTNWELSADRANATRRLLAESGLPETRFRRVTGMADRDPLLPAEPLAAANRRISILVLRTGRAAQ